jgi:hypothetical protein
MLGGFPCIGLSNSWLRVPPLKSPIEGLSGASRSLIGLIPPCSAQPMTASKAAKTEEGNRQGYDYFLSQRSINKIYFGF